MHSQLPFSFSLFMKRLLSSFVQLPVSTEIDKNELIHEYVKNHQLFFCGTFRQLTKRFRQRYFVIFKYTWFLIFKQQPIHLNSFFEKQCAFNFNRKSLDICYQRPVRNIINMTIIYWPLSITYFYYSSIIESEYHCVIFNFYSIVQRSLMYMPKGL